MLLCGIPVKQGSSQGISVLIHGVSAHWKCDQETNDSIASVFSCFLCLVQVKCYQTWLFCLQKNIREQRTALADEHFLLKGEQCLSYSLNERQLFWGEEMALVLKALCWGLTLTKGFLQRQYISFTLWIIDGVHNFNLFLRSSHKNKFCMYNSFLQTPELIAMFPGSLCPCFLISLYLSTSRDLPCPLFCGRAGNHWVL